MTTLAEIHDKRREFHHYSPNVPWAELDDAHKLAYAWHVVRKAAYASQDDAFIFPDYTREAFEMIFADRTANG